MGAHRNTGLTRIPALVLLTLGAALFTTEPIQGQSEETLVAFDEGVRLFENEDYAAALGAFQIAETSGTVSSALFYNIGNTYFRLNQLGRAILYYERALRLDSSNEHIQHSLSVARERTEDRFSRIPEPVWISAWHAVVRFLQPGGLFAIGLLFYLFGIGLAAQRIYLGTPNDWLRRGFVVGLAVGCVLLIAGLYASHELTLVQEGVVLDTSTEVFELPDASEDPLVIVHEGLVVGLVNSRDNWREIRLPNGVTGWVRDDVLEAI
jgi:tetratricopeptide (TPR) repeat protein